MGKDLARYLIKNVFIKTSGLIVVTEAQNYSQLKESDNLLYRVNVDDIHIPRLFL